MTHFFECFWREDGVNVECGATGIHWDLLFDEFDLIWRLFHETGAVEYRRNAADWNCIGSNLMSKFSDNGFCTGWPDTILVVPV